MVIGLCRLRGNDQSIRSAVSDAIVGSWLWSTATGSSPLGYSIALVQVVDNRPRPAFRGNRCCTGRHLAIEDFKDLYVIGHDTTPIPLWYFYGTFNMLLYDTLTILLRHFYGTTAFPNAGARRGCIWENNVALNLPARLSVHVHAMVFVQYNRREKINIHVFSPSHIELVDCREHLYILQVREFYCVFNYKLHLHVLHVATDK